MSEHRCMLNKMNKIEIYVANEDTDINPSVQEAIEYVLKQNDPVGTVAGYYDEKLTIWSVSNYFCSFWGGMTLMNYEGIRRLYAQCGL